MSYFQTSPTEAKSPPTCGFRQHWFTLGDCCVAVSEGTSARESSDAPLLFFLHGRFETADAWRATVRALYHPASSFLPEFPGFGRSFAVPTRGLALLEHAMLVGHLLKRLLPPGRKAILIGHDLGGLVAQICALDQPERVQALVLVNSTCFVDDDLAIRPGAFGWRLRRRLAELRARSLRSPEEGKSCLLAGRVGRVNRSCLIEAVRGLECTWPGRFERQTWRENLKNLTHPSLLLWGRQDPLNPVTRGRELMRMLPQAELYEHEEAGHWPAHEASDWLLSKLQEFIFRVSRVHRAGDLLGERRAKA